jgi:hypothetical protein
VLTAPTRVPCATGCLKKYPQLTMRTRARALAAIVEHASKTGDEQGDFALGVKLCNLDGTRDTARPCADIII